MINFIAGVAVGAAFAPFWITLLKLAKIKFVEWQNKPPAEK